MAARGKKKAVAKRRITARGAPEPRKAAPHAGVAKISVSLAADELEWAKKKAEQEGSTVSAVIALALRERRRAEAWNEFMSWALDGKPLTPEEIVAAERKLSGTHA